MAKRRRPIDRVRGSRDGHEYHEAWTARKALQLLRPDSDLIAIAVEGLSPADQTSATAVTVQVADVTMYFGGEPNFKEATKTTVAQLKYSITDRDENFRVSKAKKTIEKFSKTYQDYKRKYGTQAVEKKLDFQLITNQPISKSFAEAIDALASDTQSRGDVQKQVVQFQRASGLTGRPLSAFARKFHLLGSTNDLPTTKSELASLLVDWSASSDSIASVRLGNLRQMVRDKAGYAGTNNNLINRTDILAVLEIDDPQDLLPCESRLPDVGKVIEREQLVQALNHISQLNTPLLIQATGGIGKSVFMKMLEDKLGENFEVVFFDCFGGGAYRSPEDARHLPQNGIIHIANTLAFRGLCDPMLPHNPDAQGLLRTFRRRLIQCIDTIHRVVPGRKLALLLDAIDNASIAANQRSDDCFPVMLMESLHSEPVDGVKLIVSSRPERKPTTYANYAILDLPPFTKDETAHFLNERVTNPTKEEINVAQARSGGNPRVMEYMLKDGCLMSDTTENQSKIELDELILKRIEKALETAIEKGYESNDIEAFLAGLAVLPPPVPLDEYAGAHGIDPAAVESFASDLHPLLERSNQGLMFRDEPTETIVHNRFATSEIALQRVASNLLARQGMSVYAARALPGLLHQLDDSEKLFQLAFDDRIPSTISSTVGKRNIRYARLKAATLRAAQTEDYNKLVRLLLELSTIASVDQRGSTFVLEHPDLVVAAQDFDAIRRLFEAKTNWPGARPARLVIANILVGEPEESHRHARVARDWIEHYWRTQRTQENGVESERRPEHIDVAAIPFFYLSEGQEIEAVRYLNNWRDWFAYEVCELIFSFADFAQFKGVTIPKRLNRFVGSLSNIGSLTAALSFQVSTRAKRVELVANLARLCKRTTKLDLPESYHRSHNYQLQEGLRKSAAIALSLNQSAEAMSISLRAPHKRHSLWHFRHQLHRHEVFPFVFRVALRAAVKKNPVHEKDILPSELVSICSRISRDVTGKAFQEKARDKITNYKKSKKQDINKPTTSQALGDEDLRSAEQFLTQRLEPLLVITKSLSALLGTSNEGLDKSFCELIKAWETSLINRDPYIRTETDPFFRMLGFDIVFFAFWARPDLKQATVRRFLNLVNKHKIGTSSLVSIIAILSKIEGMRELAGELAVTTRALIENENDVNTRASLLGDLGRAILPASADEASTYFRLGLDQLDAIGSGDYNYTHELLQFASKMKGDEIGEREFHILTNICELNMGDEPRKFYWGPYGKGISNVAGLRGLAKLCRWDDRSRISLQYTLLPYLIGLLELGKINVYDALALNRLAKPVEYFFASTKEFAELIRKRAGPDSVAIEELIIQFQDNNPDRAVVETVETLANLAKEAIGSNSGLSKYLDTASVRYKEISETLDKRDSTRNITHLRVVTESENRDGTYRENISRIISSTDPLDEASLDCAIDRFNEIGERYHLYKLQSCFFSELRKKVSYDCRSKYVRNIAGLDNVPLEWKIKELKKAREAWEDSSSSLKQVFAETANQLIGIHAEDLVHHGYLSDYDITKISETTGVTKHKLIFGLIKSFAHRDSMASGTVWLAFAAFICPHVDTGQGQLALKRLLSSEAARLADNVTDGGWMRELYPPNVFADIAAGMIWRILGSPHATDRWRAAHCLRTFAKFGRWEVIDKVVAKVGSVNAGPFQAGELPFFFLHARLWLLIAIARMVNDFPNQIARYKDYLLTCALEDKNPHILMRHFACRTLLKCVETGELELDATLENHVRVADQSPYQRLMKKIRSNGGFFSGRPRSIPESEFRFRLDYKFHEHDVDSLAQVFGQPCYKVADMISEIVHQFDPEVEAMYSTGGRESLSGRDGYGITTHYHTYGQQLGWHALFWAAGKLLRDYPTTDDWYYDNPWDEWFSRYRLTRDDGLWLSDGTDKIPLDTVRCLLESKDNELAITGNRDTILDLAEIRSGVGNYTTVYGRWFSADEVEVSISSALVSSNQGESLANKLIHEVPMIVWVPFYVDSEGVSEYVQGEKKGYKPWIVCPSDDAMLDENDPYGVSVANLRPRLAQEFNNFCSLTKRDAFGRVWRNNQHTSVLFSQAWGRVNGIEEGGPHAGTRLTCDSSIIKEILTTYDKDLLVLIVLQRYEKGSYNRDSRFSHTVGVARITKSFNLDYYEGCINHVHKTQW